MTLITPDKIHKGDPITPDAQQPKILAARVKKSDVSKIYRNKVSLYDYWGELTERTARQRCLKMAAIQDGEAILEVAVGTGLAFTEIIKSNPSGRKEGIDLTPEMLAKAEQKAKRMGAQNYKLQVGDAYDLPYEDGSFDLVINNYMFDLLPQEEFGQPLQEFKRVLKPGGRLVLVNMTPGKHWYNQVWEWLYRVKPAAIGGCRGVALHSPLQAAGFTVLQREFVSQMTFPSEIILAIKPQFGGNNV